MGNVSLCYSIACPNPSMTQLDLRDYAALVAEDETMSPLDDTIENKLA